MKILRLVVTAFLLLLVAVTSSLFCLVSRPGIMAREINRLPGAASIGMGPEAVALYIDHTSRYLLGEESDPNLKLTIGDEERWFLNERESRHMEDVKQLFEMAKRVRLIALLLLFVLLIVCPLVTRGNRAGSTLGRATLLAALMGTGIALGAGLSFTVAFTRFHELFFSNDLWQLDPATDLLINIVPEEFFLRMAVLLFLGFLFFLLFAFLIAVALEAIVSRKIIDKGMWAS